MLPKPTITLTPMGKEKHYVYTLSFPKGIFTLAGEDLSDIIFYVGRGTWKVYARTGAQRIDTHEYEARGYVLYRSFNPRSYSLAIANWYKIDAIRHIWVSGNSVVKQVIFETSSLQEVKEVERRTINTHRGPYLANRENFPLRRTRDWLTSLSPNSKQYPYG